MNCRTRKQIELPNQTNIEEKTGDSMYKSPLFLLLLVSSLLANSPYTFLLRGFLDYENSNRRVTFFHGDRVPRMQNVITKGSSENLTGNSSIDFQHKTGNQDLMHFKAVLKDRTLNITITNKSCSPYQVFDTTVTLEKPSYWKESHNVITGINGFFKLKRPFMYKGTKITKISYRCNYMMVLTPKSKDLYNAVKKNDIDKAKTILTSGVNPNFYMYSYGLLKAAKTPEMINILCKNGAEVLFDEKVLYNQLRYTGTYRFELFKALVDNINTLDFRFKEDGDTPLNWLIRQDYIDAVKYVIETGKADVNYASKRKQGSFAPLDLAMIDNFYAENQKAIKAYLISKGAKQKNRSELYQNRRR